MKEFSIRLKELRTKERLTQEELACELGVPVKTYRNWECKGKGHTMPDIIMLRKIAKTLDATLDELVGE